ncbi:hypothetical protein [Rhodococcus sp. NPDC049939]|uniref:hypothetical protein n=1 Tax=Rhodococcus sp. NPDC049939 TaxID=3155511 RepID=UPI0033E2DB2D
MTVLALIALGVATLAPPVLGVTPRPLWVSQWAAPITAGTALAIAAIAAASTTPVTGFALGATLVLAVTAAATGGGPLVLAAFRIARRQPDAGTESAPAPASGPLRGGRVIGLLERAAVAAAVLAGWPEGIAIVLAVKGLARYPELREPHASEQFIIGTFTSVLWAVAVCGTGYALIT